MFDHLQKLDLAGMTQVNPKKVGAHVDPTAGIDADRILISKYERHQADFRVRSRKAKELLQRLPEPGEVFSILMSGAFDGFDFVEAILQLAAPATIAELYVATLGFSEDNSGQLIQQIDSGRIGKVWFTASCYMRDGKHGDKFQRLSQVLHKRGCHCRATRNHAKILAMRLTDGRTISIDGSLNFSSCSNVEQAHAWNDTELFNFYAAYIKEQAEGRERVK